LGPANRPGKAEERALAFPTLLPSLQNKHGGHTVHGLASLLNGKIGFAEQSVGLGRGEALVPKMDGQFEMLAEIVGKYLNFLGLDALGTGHAERQADDDLFDIVFTDDPVKAGEVVLLVLPMERVQALRSNAERVGHGDADTPGPDVESEDALGWCQTWFGSHAGIIRFGRRASDFQG